MIANILKTVALLLLLVLSLYAQGLDQLDPKGRYETDRVKVRVDYKTFFTQLEAKGFASEKEAEDYMKSLGFVVTTAQDARQVDWIYWNELVGGYVWKVKLRPIAKLAIKGDTEYLLECEIKYSSGVVKFRPNRLKLIEKVEVPVSIVEETTPARPVIKRKCEDCEPAPPPKPRVAQLSCPIWGEAHEGASKGRKFNQIAVHAGLYGGGGSAGAGMGVAKVLKDNPSYGKTALTSGLAGFGTSIFLQLVTRPRDGDGKKRFFGVDMLTVQSPSVGKVGIKKNETKSLGKFGSLVWEGDIVAYVPSEQYANLEEDCARQWQVTQSTNNNWFLVPIPRGSNNPSYARQTPVKTTAGKSPDRTGSISATNGYVAPQRAVTGDIPKAVVVNKSYLPKTDGVKREVGW